MTCGAQADEQGRLEIPQRIVVPPCSQVRIADGRDGVRVADVVPAQRSRPADMATEDRRIKFSEALM